MEIMRTWGHQFQRNHWPLSGAPLLAMVYVQPGCLGGSGAQPSQTQPVSTTTALTTSSSQANSGSLVTFTSTVQSAGSAVSMGSVTFLDGSASLTTATLNSSGHATWSSSSLAVGTHTFSARYAGTAAYASSASSDAGTFHSVRVSTWP